MELPLPVRGVAFSNWRTQTGGLALKASFAAPAGTSWLSTDFN